MIKSGRVAVGRYSTRGRMQLVLLRPMGEGLAMHGLYYADEVRSFDDVEFGDAVEVKKGELDLANQLIEQLSSPRFEPEKYEDEYRRDVLQAVEKKSVGEAVVAPPTAEEREQIIDLVAALKRSLGEKRPPASLKAVARERKPAKAKGKKEPSRSARSGS